MGYRTTNANWRNFYLSAAAELDGTLDRSLAVEMSSPDMLQSIGAPFLLEGLRFRVDPDKAAGVMKSAGFRITDTGDTIGLALRDGVLEAMPYIPADAMFVVELPKMAAVGVVLGAAEVALRKVVGDGIATVTTRTLKDAITFFGYFDPTSKTPINLADR